MLDLLRLLIYALKDTIDDMVRLAKKKDDWLLPVILLLALLAVVVLLCVR